MSKELASAWLERAEKIAGVEKQKGSLWHAYRRKWATERKHLPDVDIAAAGGWSDLSSLKSGLGAWGRYRTGHDMWESYRDIVTKESYWLPSRCSFMPS